MSGADPAGVPSGHTRCALDRRAELEKVLLQRHKLSDMSQKAISAMTLAT
jgi:hypothetical protein